MGFWAILFVTCAYVLTSVDFLRHRQPWWAVIYAGYAFANIGALVLAYKVLMEKP